MRVFAASISPSACEMAPSQPLAGRLDATLDKCVDSCVVILYYLLTMTDESPATSVDPVADSYQKAFDIAVGDLARLQAERDTVQTQLDGLDSRIERVRQGALGLAALIDLDFLQLKQRHPRLFDDSHDPRIGITEAVRAAMTESPETLSPVDIKERVLQIAPAVAGHKNPMASIHAVLRRLVDSGEVVMAVFTETGRTVYGWIGDANKLEIKLKLAQWFSNPEYVFKQNEDKWKDREEGSDPELQALVEAMLRRRRGEPPMPPMPVPVKRKKGGRKSSKTKEGSLKED